MHRHRSRTFCVACCTLTPSSHKTARCVLRTAVTLAALLNNILYNFLTSRRLPSDVTPSVTSSRLVTNESLPRNTSHAHQKYTSSFFFDRNQDIVDSRHYINLKLQSDYVGVCTVRVDAEMTVRFTLGALRVPFPPHFADAKRRTL